MGISFPILRLQNMFNLSERQRFRAVLLLDVMDNRLLA
jgi:hypothetical protein